MTFTDSAARLAGLAAVIAGWRPDEFWAATPAELGTMLAAFAPEGGTAALDGRGLAALMEAIPDE